MSAKAIQELDRPTNSATQQTVDEPLMPGVAPLGGVYQAGTLSGNPLAVAAGLAALRALASGEPYARLEALGARLEAGLVGAARAASVPLTVNRVGSMLTGFFCEGPVTDYASARRADRERYARFMRELCDMVVTKYDGSLKAEHGTGRNIAPFVELEWGVQATRLMRRIKTLFDPENLLNPGVIINDDARAHLTHLKPLPAAEFEAYLKGKRIAASETGLAANAKFQRRAAKGPGRHSAA